MENVVRGAQARQLPCTVHTMAAVWDGEPNPPVSHMVNGWPEVCAMWVEWQPTSIMTMITPAW